MLYSTVSSESTLESIKGFLEDQAISPLFDLAPHPSPRPRFPVSKLDRRNTGRYEKERQLADGRLGAGGGGGGARSYADEKAWSSVNHSILSGPHKTLEKGSTKAICPVPFFD